MNTNPKVTLIVDRDERYRRAPDHEIFMDAAQEANLLIRCAGVLGQANKKLAIVSTQEPLGIQAYQQAGYETYAVNGKRKEELERLVQNESEKMRQASPDILVLVTSDPKFATLASQVIASVQAEVYILANQAQIPPEFRDERYKIRDLNLILTSQHHLAVFLDIENIIIGLLNSGYRLDPQALFRAIEKSLQDLGEIDSITAYADWDQLGRDHSARNMQRELTQLGVNTQYLISRNGKNSADMRMVNNIHNWLEDRKLNPRQGDILVLGSGDRDFRDVIRVAQQQGIKVLILSHRPNLSNDLAASGDTVRYLEDYLEPPRAETSPSAEQKIYPNHVALVMKIRAWMKRQKYSFAYVHELKREPWFTVSQEKQIEEAVGDGIFLQTWRYSRTEGPHSEAVELNPDHHLCQAVDYFSDWVCHQVDICLNRKKMPYVDTHYLAEGMRLNANLRDWGIGQVRESANLWLEAAFQAGLLVRQETRHPNNDERDMRRIITWRLP